MIKITEATFKEALFRLAKTDDGRALLAYLSATCFYNRDCFVKGDQQHTYVLAAIQKIYRDIRKYVDINDLIVIENNYQLVNDSTKKVKDD